MAATETEATTLAELLAQLRQGYDLHVPILVEVTADQSIMSEDLETVTMASPEVDWTAHCADEHRDSSFLLLGANSPNTLSDTLSIGRSSRCDVRILNNSVSKVHALVTFDRPTRQYLITDQNSRNHTSVNGETLAPDVPTSLCAGAYVGFGDALFLFIDPSILNALAGG